MAGGLAGAANPDGLWGAADPDGLAGPAGCGAFGAARAPNVLEALDTLGGIVVPALRSGSGGGCVVPEVRGGSWTPVGGALRARRGGRGGSRRPHD